MLDNEQGTQEEPQENTSSPNESNSGGVDMENAKQKAKEAFNDATGSLKDMLADPMGGIANLAHSLNKSQLITTGVIFGSVYIISLFLILRSFIVSSPFIANVWKFSNDFRLFIACLVPVAAIVLGFILLGKVFGKSVTLEKCLFASGVSFLPLGLANILGWICLKLFSNGNIVGAIILFGLCFFILLVYAGILEVLRITTRLAFFMTPTLILFTMIVSYYTYKIMS